MRLLVFGDAHLKHAGVDVDVSGVTLPAGTDAVLVVGDLVDDPEPEYLAEGRAFLEELAGRGVPVLSVPGNHDPLDAHREMVAPVDGARVLHDDVVAVDGIGIAGLGCEQFDQKTAVEVTDFPALDPRDADDRRHAADEVATRLEAGMQSFLEDETGATELRERLGIERARAPEFRSQLERLERRVERYDDLLGRLDGRGVVATHVPPYGFDLDRHHSAGNRDDDRQFLHEGSLALTLALRAHRPLLSLSGHSHNGGFELLGEDEPRVHLLNLGFRGILIVDVDDEGVGYDRLD